MPCARRLRLEQKHDQASATLDSVKNRLRERLGRCAQGEFLTLNDELDRASELVQHARAALDSHIRQHCCLTQEGASAQETS
jgi:hypothetical protein